MIKELKGKAREKLEEEYIQPTTEGDILSFEEGESGIGQLKELIDEIVSETALAVISHFESLLESAGDNTWKEEMQDNVEKFKQEIKDNE